MAVLVIDLDGFKEINDADGHKAGDEVLRVIAERLKGCLRSADTVARFGGDEFVAVISALAQPEDVALVATKIIDSVAQPIPRSWTASRDPSEVRIGCSIGITLHPRDADNADALIRLADAAMYRAKQAGRGRFAYHEREGRGPS